MPQIEKNVQIINIKADSVSREEINYLRTKLLYDFYIRFSDFLDQFKDMNTILNKSQDKNLLFYFEEINKTLAIFVREAESINTDKSKTNNFSNLERSIKRQLNFLSKISYINFSNKPLLIDIDNNSIELYSLTRFLHDIFFIEKNIQKQNEDEMAFSLEKEYQRIANELRNRYPRYNGIKLDIKDYVDELDIKFVLPAQEELKRKLKETMQKIKTNLQEFISWELRKTGLIGKCFILITGNSISLAYYMQEEEDEDKPDACENCNKKTEDLSHFNKSGIDEYVCDDCYIEHLQEIYS